MNILIFFLFLFATAALAYARGGRPEKTIALSLVVATVLTFLTGLLASVSFDTVEIGLLVIDIALLGVMLLVAMRADRYWPMVVAALQLILVLVHIAKVVSGDALPWVYAFVLAFWSYPILAVVMIGTWRHSRRTRRRVESISP